MDIGKKCLRLRGGKSISLIAMIFKPFKSKELIRSRIALNMAKLTKIAYFWSVRGKIDFENLLVLQKTA